MKIGIDLLWIRTGKVGGTESYIRNLLDGFLNFADEKFEFYLFLSFDNKKSFGKYLKHKKFREIACPVSSKNVFKRILWENINLDRYAKQYNLDAMFIPVYSMPFYISKKIKYLTVIHDLQSLHYPHYFSRTKNHWMRLSWRNTIKKSDKIISISNFVREDIINQFRLKKKTSEKIKVIYNPIVIDHEFEPFDKLSKKYGIKNNCYFYTVSSLLPHKNLGTILQTMNKIKGTQLPQKLLITGISGKSETTLKEKIKELDISDMVTLTGYVSNAERNSLYKNTFCFLFPSIFEGFGMPPVEASLLGSPVITTKEASLQEITKGNLKYVDNPFSPDDWVKQIMLINQNYQKFKFLYPEYCLEKISRDYLSTIYSL